MSGSYRAPLQVLPDEPELGLQRWCARCEEWWPLGREFWYVHPTDRTRVQCRACLRESSRRWNERNPERRRHMWREAGRRSRARRAAMQDREGSSHALSGNGRRMTRAGGTPSASRPCPGRGCLAMIPADRALCHFCTRSVELERRSAA